MSKPEKKSTRAQGFTPGPWTATTRPKTDVQPVAHLAFSQWVVVTPSELGGDSKADAHLIAAAPDLLEALEEMVAWALKMAKVPRPDSPVAKARAAITKARGQ